MEPSIDYDHPDSIPAAERAISLVGRMVVARVHGPMDQHQIVGRCSDWGYDSGGVVVWVDGEEVWQHDCRPV
jgi:hypothetical protein